METIIKFFENLNKAWDKEPETLIDLGITDDVFMNIENYIIANTVGFKTYKTEDGHIKADCPKCEGSEHIEDLKNYGRCVTCRVKENNKLNNYENEKMG